MVDAHAAAARPLAVPPLRSEYLRDVVAGEDIGVVQQPLTVWQRLANQSWLRKAFILFVIGIDPRRWQENYMFSREFEAEYPKLLMRGAVYFLVTFIARYVF